MKIVIIGAGFTGIQLAKRLINEQNEVTLIDNDEETVRHASNRLDCAVVLADGNSLATLEDAGIAKANALVCVTDNDEVNMITCSLVDAVYPDLLKIARVRNYAYYVNSSQAVEKHAESFSGKHRPLYGIDYMVHPDVEAAEAIVHAVENGAVNDVLTFDNSPYELTRLTVCKGCSLDGQSIQNMRNLTDRRFLVAYVEGKENTSLPSGPKVLHEGDSIGVLTKKDDMSAVMQLCGTEGGELKKIALIGAGRIGSIIAERLIQRKKTTLLSSLFNIKSKLQQHFVIVDSDEKLAKAASAEFPEAHVFFADITDEGFIEEEGISSFDLAIFATHNREMNMVMAAYLESLGVKRTISLVESSAYANIARKLGVDVPVPLRDAIVDSIMGHLRGNSVQGVHTVSSGALEIVEYVVPSGAWVAGKALRQISDPGVFLVLLVQKAGCEYAIPSGDTVLVPGDHVLLITAAAGNQKLIDRFNGK